MTVTYKFQIPLNATGHLPPSNKEEQLKIAMDKLAYPSPLNDKHKYKGIFVLRPVIDRLEIGSSVPKGDYDDFLKVFNSYGFPATDEWKLLVNEHKKALKKKLGFAQHAFEWSPDGQWRGAVLVALRSNKDDCYVKLIFTPSLLSAKDMEQFKHFWNCFFINHDHVGLKLHQLYQKKNAIRRLDIAVDFLNAHVSAFFPKFSSSVSASSVQKKTKMTIYQNPTGRKQTIYLPYSPKATMNDYLYNKRQELLDKGHSPLYGEIPHTRFERRIETELSVSELPKLKNRLAHYDLKVFDRRALTNKSDLHVFFVNYALLRTPEKAAELINQGEKLEYTNFFSEHLVDCWHADSVWSYWPAELKRLGLSA